MYVFVHICISVYAYMCTSMYVSKRPWLHNKRLQFTTHEEGETLKGERTTAIRKFLAYYLSSEVLCVAYVSPKCEEETKRENS